MYAEYMSYNMRNCIISCGGAILCIKYMICMCMSVIFYCLDIFCVVFVKFMFVFAFGDFGPSGVALADAFGMVCFTTFRSVWCFALYGGSLNRV